MKTVLSLAVLVICMARLSTGYYHDINTSELKDANVLNNFAIVFESDHTNAFPQSFKLHFDHELNHEFDSEFVKMENSGSKDVYLINSETNEPYKYQFETQDHELEQYLSVDGRGAAALIRNAEDSANKFRVLATVFSNKESNVAIDIMPVNVVDAEKRSVDASVFDASSNAHQIAKRSTLVQFGIDELNQPNNQTGNNMPNVTFSSFEANIINMMENKRRNAKRGVNGPVSLIVELLPVADCSTFQAVKTKLNTNDNNRAISFIKTYYAQAVALINTRYQISLKSDNDLRITVVLANFLILTDNSQCAWSNPSIVGDRNYPTYEGRYTVLADGTLNAYTDYMNSLKLGFEYDHSSGIFTHDMISSSSGDINARKGTVGYAPVAAICKTAPYKVQKHSIIEEQYPGSFAIVGIIAHELGHNLGANHDGDGSWKQCPANYNYIMSPSPGADNLENQLVFSPCSIYQFKQYLIAGDKATGGSCLVGQSTKSPPEASNPDNLYPGRNSNVNQQCQQIFGPTWVFAGDGDNQRIGTICSSLWCKDITNATYSYTRYQGAIDGTPCGSGMSCSNMKCVSDSKAPVSDFPFGDGAVTFTNGRLPKPGNSRWPGALTCAQTFAQFESKGISINAFCNDPNTASQCPLSCSKYNKVKCQDQIYECVDMGFGKCNKGYSFTINGLKKKLEDLCPRTCKSCPADKASDYSNVCMNGGTLTNASTSPSGCNVNFSCRCPTGFTGTFCESPL